MHPEPEEAARWLAYAVEDLEHGKLGASSFPRSAAWSFQQAAEKALKALFLASGQSVPKVHDLVFLLQGLATRFPRSSELLDSVMDLAEISTVSRYPSELDEITTRDCARFQVAATNIVGWCQGQLGTTPE